MDDPRWLPVVAAYMEMGQECWTDEQPATWADAVFLANVAMEAILAFEASLRG